MDKVTDIEMAKFYGTTDRTLRNYKKSKDIKIQRRYEALYRFAKEEMHPKPIVLTMGKYFIYSVPPHHPEDRVEFLLQAGKITETSVGENMKDQAEKAREAIKELATTKA